MPDRTDPYVGAAGDPGSPGTPDGVGGQGGQGGRGGHGERGAQGVPGTPGTIPSIIPDLYTQLGILTGRIEELGLKIDQQGDRVSRLQCAAHALRVDRVEADLAKIEAAIGAPPQPPRSPSSVQPAVTPRDLDRLVAQLDDSLEGKVAASVIEVLQAQRAEEERAAKERRDAAAVAAAEADKSRWARIQWAVGIVTTVLGSGTVLSYCNTKQTMAEDRQAVVRALQAQPQPVVVKIPTPAPVPVPVPAPKEEP